MKDWRGDEEHIGQLIRKNYVFRVFKQLDLDGKNILDAGCGSGDYLIFLAQDYPTSHIEGLDCDASKILAIKDKLFALRLKNASIFQGDLTNSFGKERYDFIYAIDVMEHIKDDQVALVNMFEALKSNGLLLIHVPLKNQRFYLRHSYIPESDHVRNGYSEKDLIQKIKFAGFSIIKKEYTFGFFGTVAWEVMKLTQNSNSFTKFFAKCLISLSSKIEILYHKSKGNCLLLLARVVKTEGN